MMKVYLLVSFVMTLCLGYRVKRQGWFGTKPADAKCLFEEYVCRDYCKNGGTCILDESSCSPGKCECLPGFTGIKCESGTTEPVSLTEQTSPTTSPNVSCARPLEERRCMSYFICQNGYCDKSSVFMRCVCDDFWVGSKCSKLDCSRGCGTGELCSIENCELKCFQTITTNSSKKDAMNTTTTTLSSLRPLTDRFCAPTFICIHGYCRNSAGVSCVCDPGYSGLFCDKILQTTPSIPELNSWDVCSEDYKNRSILERKCFNGLLCIFGKCKQVEINFDGTKLNASRCECDENAVGERCQHSCCLDCGEYGRCVVESQAQKTFCNCQNDYFGKFCENRTVTEIKVTKPDESEESTKWYVWLVCACVLVLLMLALLLIAVPYLLWRKGVLSIMEIVYYFQPFEEKDEMKLDVLVLYHSTDHSFVKCKLYPVIQEQFHQNISCQNHQTTEEKSSSDIVLDITTARRVILVLSADFVQYQWPQYLDPQVLTELFKIKQRIILVSLKDFLEVKTDPNLQDLISKGPCLRWPSDKEDRFWKRMFLLLPKKRNKDFKKASCFVNNNNKKRVINVINIPNILKNKEINKC